MLTRHTWAATAVLGLVLSALGVSSGPALAADELMVMDLPAQGPLAEAAGVVSELARRDGRDLWWLRRQEPRQRDRTPLAIVMHTSAPLCRDQGKTMLEFVTKGGGLVFVAETAGEQLRANRAFLEPFDLRVYGLGEEQGAPKYGTHPIVGGGTPAAAVGIQSSFSARGVTVLVTLNDRPVAVVGTLGKGRFVVVSDALVAAPERAAADAPPLVLMRRAVRWACGMELTPLGGTVTSKPTGDKPPATPKPADPPVQPPVTPPAQPVAPLTLERLTGLVLVDLATPPPDPKVKEKDRPRWPEIREHVEKVLDAAGLQRRAFAFTAGTGTLAQALASPPKLLVLGSTRLFEEQEAGAFARYIWEGGSALALAYAQEKTVPQMQALNRLLAETDVAATWGRSAGKATPVTSALTAGLQGWGKLPVGTAAWTSSGLPQVTVDGDAVVVAQEFGKGRVVVFDGLALLTPPDAKKPQDDTSPVFRELLARCLQWLAGGH